MASDTPVIPRSITVHLGRPTAAARNVTVPFTDYLKNVASSEIYPTWPENAIRANIYAQASFALNRIYTEHYRSRGYDFDITNSTAYDQAYVDGRSVFSNVAKLVDELFNNYVTKGDQVQPYFTQYCSGREVTCPGLSQWGTVTLANQGYTPYRILRYYYGNDINIKTAPIKDIRESYPGRAVRLGDVSEDVRIIQRQLNRIARNYPAIPLIPSPNGIFDTATRESVKKFQSIFSLTVDGIVGKATWYKIKQLYAGILKLGELYSEGLRLTDVERQFKTVIKRGDRGQDVSTIQYFLNFIGSFTNNIQSPAVEASSVGTPTTASCSFSSSTALRRTALSGATHGTSCKRYIMIFCEPSRANFRYTTNMRASPTPATTCSGAARAARYEISRNIFRYSRVESRAYRMSRRTASSALRRRRRSRRLSGTSD